MEWVWWRMSVPELSLHFSSKISPPGRRFHRFYCGPLSTSPPVGQQAVWLQRYHHMITRPSLADRWVMGWRGRRCRLGFNDPPEPQCGHLYVLNANVDGAVSVPQRSFYSWYHFFFFKPLCFALNRSNHNQSLPPRKNKLANVTWRKIIFKDYFLSYIWDLICFFLVLSFKCIRFRWI